MVLDVGYHRCRHRQGAGGLLVRPVGLRGEMGFLDVDVRWMAAAVVGEEAVVIQDGEGLRGLVGHEEDLDGGLAIGNCLNLALGHLDWEGWAVLAAWADELVAAAVNRGLWVAKVRFLGDHPATDDGTDRRKSQVEKVVEQPAVQTAYH